MDQHFGECLSVLGGKHKPATGSSYLWPVISSAALRLPRRITTKSARPISSGGAQPVHRGVVSLTEPGAATSAMVALTASQRAVAHDVSSRTIGIGTGRIGICGTHLEPLADLTCPHILQESLPGFVITLDIWYPYGRTE